MLAKSFRGKFASFLALVFSVIFLTGCGLNNDYTETIPEFYDYADNQLQGVEATYSDNAFGCTARFEYKGLPIGGMSLNERYKEWTADGQPDEAIEYVYHYIYTSDGEGHVLYYDNGTDTCFEISLPDPYGEYSGVRVYLGEDGAYYVKNPVTGTMNDDREERKFYANQAYYYGKAEEIMHSLDPGYLANLD